MADRNTKTGLETYTTGGETHRNTATQLEAYTTGGETFRNSRTVLEVYCTVTTGVSAKPYAFVVA